MSFLSPEVCKQRQEIHLSRMLSREFTHVEGIFFFNPEMESSVHKLRVGDEERRHPVSGKGLGGESGGLSSALPPSDCGASVWGLPSAQHCSAP